MAVRNLQGTITLLGGAALAFAGLVLVLVLVATTAEAGLIGGKLDESLPKFSGFALHADIPANATHGWTAAPLSFGGTFWGFEGEIEETEKAGAANDKLRINGKVQHLKAPHPPEPAPNPKKLTFDINVEAGKGIIAAAGLNELTPASDSVKHGDHFDEIEVRGRVLVNANLKDIETYIVVLVGGHNGEAEGGGAKKKGECPPEPDPGLPEDFIASSVWLLEPSSGEFTLSLAVSNVSLGDVLEAQIRLGSPQTPGPIVFPLNPAAFEAADGGVGRLIDDGQFPLAHVDDLLANNTFMEIVTPSGGLRGQCVAQATVGGTLEFPGGGSDTLADSPASSSSRDHAAPMAAAIAGAVSVLAAGGWYARRRFRQRRI